ncbi:hypothetical protein IC229_22055 [Spirosoma sp. BT702]|uniref:Uncharacterized protein n=1 Tax=Spirosoma profusum TaxID=2771354 RepID=A0A926XYR8_9BACT|nr:hypothetical protein [Spirosoma profusum]MBD2703344.1 hypothetical protein [Spirosoma profusum]
MKHEIHYITTDLDLRAPVDLTPLSHALEKQGLWAYLSGPWQGLWSAQIGAEESFPEPDPYIAAMLTAIESLDQPARDLWSACTIREFNIGYDCGDRPWAFHQELLPATLARIAQVGASLVITIYPVIETDAVEAAIAVLKKDSWIRRRRGKANGYGVHHADSSSLKKNQAEVKVTLYGKKESVYVHCLMQLSIEGEWVLQEIIKKEVWVASCSLKPQAPTE